MFTLMHCMQAGSHRLGNAVVDNVLTCPVVDGVELEHRPGYSTGQEYEEDRELSEEDNSIQGLEQGTDHISVSRCCIYPPHFQ